MKIGVLSRNHTLYSTRRLVESGQERGHEVTLIDTLAVVVEINANNGQIRVMNKRPSTLAPSVWGFSKQSTYSLPRFDAIIPRIGSNITEHGVAVVRQFEAKQITTTAASDAIAQSRNKLLSMQLLNQMGISIPKTAVIATPDALAIAVKSVGGTPVIIKLNQGTQGRGVILARNLVTAEAVMNKFFQAKRQVLIQEYIGEAAGQDTRIIVVGDHCVAAMKRQATNGDFRSNLHLGGTAVPIHPDPKIAALAIAAAKAHGLAVAGVDILESNRGPLILEINSSPGLEGIEGVTNIDVATQIIQHLEQTVPRG